MKEANIKAVEAFLNSLKNKDLDSAPIAENIDFEDPVAGKNSGAENFKAFLSGFLNAVNNVKIIEHICENEQIVTRWEVETVFGTIPILEKFRVENGLIVEAFGYFDPRPILGG